MQAIVNEVENKLDHFCMQAQAEEVIVKNVGFFDFVDQSCEKLSALKDAETTEPMTDRKREFNEMYKDWLAAQTQDLETTGLWCDGLVAW